MATKSADLSDQLSALTLKQATDLAAYLKEAYGLPTATPEVTARDVVASLVEAVVAHARRVAHPREASRDMNRYHELADRRLTGPLSAEESAEIARIEAALDAEDTHEQSFADRLSELRAEQQASRAILLRIEAAVDALLLKRA